MPGWQRWRSPILSQLVPRKNRLKSTARSWEFIRLRLKLLLKGFMNEVSWPKPEMLVIKTLGFFAKGGEGSLLRRHSLGSSRNLPLPWTPGRERADENARARTPAEAEGLTLGTRLYFFFSVSFLALAEINIVTIDENSQWFCLLVCNFFTSEHYRSRWENLDRGQYPIREFGSSQSLWDWAI